MSRVTSEDKIYYCQQFLDGKLSEGRIAIAAGVSKASVHMWIKKYESMGNTAFEQYKNKSYSKALKMQAVQEYLDGVDSQYGICKKYGIKSKTQLQRWISLYNDHKEMRVSGTGGRTLMSKGRKTTFEERIEIVQYCISHDHNYVKTAEKYQISYQQARNYMIKYKDGGIDALQDNRGKRKNPGELSELDRLRAEVKILKAQKEHAEMEISFLKKLEEIERRRG